ncbi:5602_t:CDS:2, partial [Paraglomus occultum]
MNKKASIIQIAVNRNDVESIKYLAKTELGLVNKELRKKCWPMLVRNYTNYEKANVDEQCITIDEKESQQILVDVNRTRKHLPSDISDHEREKFMSELYDVIVAVLERNPDLRYYQGFNMVCSVLLITLGKDDAIMVAEYLALGPLRDMLQTGLEPALERLLTVRDIVAVRDVKLYRHLESIGIMPMAHFALSWIMTWCADAINHIDDAARIFDFLLASVDEIDMCAYICASIILSRKEQLLAFGEDIDAAYITLSEFPHTNVNVITNNALTLYNASFLFRIMQKSYHCLTELRHKVSETTLTIANTVVP